MSCYVEFIHEWVEMHDQANAAIEGENIPEKMRNLETEFTVGLDPDE